MIEIKQIEEEMLEFWKNNKIYEKAVKKNSKGKKFYFLQGPPYTSGRLHIGHAWNNNMKDIAMRYFRLKGMNVWDRAGYDMHGLPTENKVQEKLKLKDKKDILKYGLDKFTKECHNFSVENAEIMNKDLKRMGIWMDFENAYMPITNEYIEGEWAFIKKAWEQKRLYLGKKVMHWDAQSETSLAKHELEYENVKDTSIFLKFQIKGKKDEYFIIWTTTPWTIFFNLAIMVNPDLEYVKVQVENEYWIVAKALAGAFIHGLLGKEYKVVEEFLGKELEGREYVHPFYNDLKKVYDNLKKQWKNVHTVILSKEYVDVSSGSGLVHCAPGCGPEDYEVGQKYGIGAFNTLNEKGEFEDMGMFNGWVAKEDDKKFIQEFEKKGCLVEKTEVEHEYPFSWRSHKPVVFRATEQWFLKIEDLVPKLLEFNKDVYWVPNRSGEDYERWTKNLRDNGLTRQRFWGCPMPIWINEKDKNDFIVIGSLNELKELAKDVPKDLHRPYIDKVVIEKNGKKYKRVEDVIDVWIDSGTASWNCLYNKPELIKEWFPADLVLEATEQTKLWFNMLQICSLIMFKKSAYKNVFVHGMILDFQGMKMSKSLGNIISPYEVIDKYCSEVLRYYLCNSTAGENINFSWEDVKQKQRNLLVLMNTANYLIDLNSKESKERGIEERYILSRLNSTIEKVTELFETYQLDETITEIEKLFLDISRVYIKVTRDKSIENREVVFSALKESYIKTIQMFSTICPLFTEYIWQQLRKKGLVNEESVHLSKWPKADKKLIDAELENEFNCALEIIEKGLAERDKTGIGLKWPLAKAMIHYYKKPDKLIENVIKNQLNVKEIIWKTEIQTRVQNKIINGEWKVELDTEITPELEAEGYARNIIRSVQSLRKKLSMVKEDKISLKIIAEEGMLMLLKKQERLIKERTNAEEFEMLNKEDKINGYEKEELNIKGKKIGIFLDKI
ncbi:MAG: isoleucine--tRNA ligase [Candidatus Pacearchaeota archaeon]